MTLRQFKIYLAAYVVENPEALDYEVVYSSDDEGNSHHPVIFSPTKGSYDKENGFCDHKLTTDECNATCIN